MNRTRSGASGADAADLPVYQNLPETSTPVRRSRRRKRRPWYKRPLRLALVTLVLLVTLGGSVGLFKFQSTMDSLHTVSTPPPVVTDNTFEDESDVAAGTAPSAPIVVDTAPAVEYLNQQRSLGLVPAVAGSGFGGSIGSFVENSGDAFSSAMSALGLSGGLDESITILLMGVDARPGSAIDVGVRPDVLALLRLDPVTGGCRGLSIPRDTRVDLPGYGKSKINHALMVGGIPYQLRVVEEFTQVEIDHYVLIDFIGFQHIVDEIGGIEVSINQDLVKNDDVVFSQGTHHFDGEAALRYARFRSFDTDQDIGRVQRQWGLLRGISKAIEGEDLVVRLNSLLPIVEGHIRTDMSAEQMSGIVKTYGGKCSSLRDTDASILRGSLVQFRDPILDEVVYYNVVPNETVQERVSMLYASLDGATVAPFTPQEAATPAVGPMATPRGARDP